MRNDGSSPFQIACQNGHTEIARALIDHGALLEVDENTSLLLASQNGNTEIVKLLLDHVS